MKARIKATGEIVNVQKISDYNSHGEYIGYYFQTSSSPFKTFNNGDLDFEYSEREPENYWEKLKHQYAGMAMQGLLSTGQYRYCSSVVTSEAFEYATALVEKLKEDKYDSK